MTAVPFVPTPLTTPIVNPAVGSSGAPPLAYVSNSQFLFAPTAINGLDLFPGGTTVQQAQSLADTIRQASAWCDDICFGSDPAAKGASLAASLTVDSALIRIKNGQLRLICDYRPLVQLVGVAVGSGMGSLASIDPSLVSLTSVGRRTFTIPYAGMVFRTGAMPAYVPGSATAGSVYAVWSYVNGYPHTKLLTAVSAAATSCVVQATDGSGGLWGVFPASGAFPGTQLTIMDQGNTESVFVQAITANTPSPGQATLTTSAFTYAHAIPTSPDFLPMTALPEDIHRAVINLTVCLVKVRGSRALVMPSTAGGRPTKQSMAQAGALEDYKIAESILSGGGYRVRQKHSGSY